MLLCERGRLCRWCLLLMSVLSARVLVLQGPLLMIAMELKAGSLRAALDGSKPLGDLRWAAMCVTWVECTAQVMK